LRSASIVVGCSDDTGRSFVLSHFNELPVIILVVHITKATNYCQTIKNTAGSGLSKSHCVLHHTGPWMQVDTGSGMSANFGLKQTF